MRFRQAAVAAFWRAGPSSGRPQPQTHSRKSVTARSRMASATARAIGTGTPFPTARILAVRDRPGRSNLYGKPCNLSSRRNGRRSRVVIAVEPLNDVAGNVNVRNSRHIFHQPPERLRFSDHTCELLKHPHAVASWRMATRAGKILA